MAASSSRAWPEFGSSPVLPNQRSGLRTPPNRLVGRRGADSPVVVGIVHDRPLRSTHPNAAHSTPTTACRGGAEFSSRKRVRCRVAEKASEERERRRVRRTEGARIEEVRRSSPQLQYVSDYDESRFRTFS